MGSRPHFSVKNGKVHRTGTWLPPWLCHPQKEPFYFWLFGEFSRLLNICTLKYMTMKYIGFNWLCKHKEQIRNSQDSISINCCTELSKTQFTIFFHVSIVKGCVTYSNCHSWLSLAGKRESGLKRGFWGAATIVVSWYF